MESSQSRTPPPTILPSAYRLHYSFILSPSLLSLSTSRPYSCDPPLIGHPNSKFSRKRIESSAHTPNSITCDHGAEPLSTDMASGTVARGGIQVPKRGGLVDPGIHATASRSYREHKTNFMASGGQGLASVDGALGFAGTFLAGVRTLREHDC